MWQLQREAPLMGQQLSLDAQSGAPSAQAVGRSARWQALSQTEPRCSMIKIAAVDLQNPRCLAPVAIHALERRFDE